MEEVISLNHSLEEAMLQPQPSQILPYLSRCEASIVDPEVDTSVASEAPTLPSETRSTRSASTASRTNRLSLTLPIAPANPYPSRPVPLSSSTRSFPPTPIDTPALFSPTEPGEFITAIASQERRVLELREELHRAECELKQLKKKFTAHEAARKWTETRNDEPLRSLDPHKGTSTLDSAARQVIELDRRKALLLGQQSQSNTPEHARRRMFSGGHTRTLSLLSPKKNGFAVHEDAPEDACPSPRPSAGHVPDQLGRRGPVTPAQLAKRASWTPRSIHQQTAGMKQIAEDLKAGLWTFVEDLRQATVGEEPITGLGPHVRGLDGMMPSTTPSIRSGEDQQDTIRASTSSARPRADAAFDQTPTSAGRPIDADEPQPTDRGTPSRPPRQPTKPKPKTETAAKTAQRSSWTPPMAGAWDDEDWSNRDTPPVKSERWSGSAIDGDKVSSPENKDENAAPRGQDHSKFPHPHAGRSPLSPLSNKLEELLPSVLNQFVPANITHKASGFMTEWDCSLSTPPIPEKTKLI